MGRASKYSIHMEAYILKAAAVGGLPSMIMAATAAGADPPLPPTYTFPSPNQISDPLRYRACICAVGTARRAVLGQFTLANAPPQCSVRAVKRWRKRWRLQCKITHITCNTATNA